jgi:hypothetical protein
MKLWPWLFFFLQGITTTAVQFEAGWAREMVLTFLRGIETQFFGYSTYNISTGLFLLPFQKGMFNIHTNLYQPLYLLVVAAWLLGPRVRIPLREWIFLSCVLVVLVAATATSWTLLRRSSTGCSCLCDWVSEWSETSTTRLPRSDLGCYVTEKNTHYRLFFKRKIRRKEIFKVYVGYIRIWARGCLGVKNIKLQLWNDQPCELWRHLVWHVFTDLIPTASSSRESSLRTM